MYFKTITISVLFLFISSFGFCQTEVDKPLSKNLVGFDISLLRTIFFNGSKYDNKFVFSETNAKTNIFVTFKYRRKIEDFFAVNIHGGYSYSKRILKPNFNLESKMNSVYNNYIADFDYTQYFLAVIPEIVLGKGIQFYLKAGIGLNLNHFDHFENAYKIVYGLDGDFVRVKRSPDLTQTRLSLKIIGDIGMQNISKSKLYIFSTGLRLSKNGINQLRNENVFVTTVGLESYFGFLFFI